MQEKNSNTDNFAVKADSIDFVALAENIKRHAMELGFSGIGITRAKPTATAITHLMNWLELGHHGGMDYMAKHAGLRSDPQRLLPGTLSVISVRLPYWPQTRSKPGWSNPTPENEGELACLSRYALGRDYHKTVRQRLQKLAMYIQNELKSGSRNHIDLPFFCRVFSDSAPVMETEFAQQAGIGWRGKHTLILAREGSWHFLGEIYTNLPLPPDTPSIDHCGSCRRCIDACPTQAIIAPYQIDARRCISYLTIELSGSIPAELRPLMGNRIYGCDDCQECCPWNRFAYRGDPDFAVRNHLDTARLTELFTWTPQEFADRLAGSPIRRIGHERWIRNIAVALGNAPCTTLIRSALEARRNDASPLVREHVAWAIHHQSDKRS